MRFSPPPNDGPWLSRNVKEIQRNVSYEDIEYLLMVYNFDLTHSVSFGIKLDQHLTLKFVLVKSWSIYESFGHVVHILTSIYLPVFGHVLHFLNLS